MMKPLRVLLLLLFLFWGGLAVSQDLEQPMGYLNAIDQQYKPVSKDMWRYISAMANGKSARKVENRRKDLLATIKASQYKIRQLPPFKKDPSLRDSVAAYFNLSYQVISEDYSKIVDMEEVAEQSYDLMEAYMLAKEKANKKLDEAGERVDEKYSAFALANGINLIEGQSKLGAKLERAGLVFEHYNRHYLLFFKTYKQEMYLMASLEKGDVNALEQNKDAMLKYVAEAVANLDTLPRYKSDLTMKQANLQMQQFYKKEAEMVPQFVDFYLKKERFEQMQKAMDAKRPADRTQEDVDQFNAAVKEYNLAINQFNKNIEQLNKSRSQHLEQWNKTVDNFLSKHVNP